MAKSFAQSAIEELRRSRHPELNCFEKGSPQFLASPTGSRVSPDQLDTRCVAKLSNRAWSVSGMVEARTRSLLWHSAMRHVALRIVNRIAIVIAAVVVPAAVAHALSSPNPNQPIGIAMIGILELLGFASVVATLRPRPLVAIVAALVYFPTVFMLIFQIGVSAGYYDFRSNFLQPQCVESGSCPKNYGLS